MRKTRFLLVSLAALMIATSAPAQDIAVKIGVLTDLSGPYADSAGRGSVLAAQLAVEDFSKQSQKLKVEVISADHQNKPDVASSISRRWLADGVNAFVDIAGSSSAFAVHELLRNANALALMSSAASSDLTGKACSPHSIHWTYDTWMLANGTGRAIVQAGGDSWFFISPDYTFGHILEAETAAVVKANGGRVLGAVKHPFPGRDFSSFILQAQASRAKVIAFSNSGHDMINAVRQWREFNGTQSAQSLAAIMLNIHDVHSLGLNASQGLMFASVFDWNLNEGTRKWSTRFEAKMGMKPSMMQAGSYSAVLHYLKAIEAAGTTNADAVAAKMKELPTDDALFGKGQVRADGRKIHDAYLFRVKKPADSKGPWDYFEVVSRIPASQAFRPLEQGGCPLVK